MLEAITAVLIAAGVLLWTAAGERPIKYRQPNCAMCSDKGWRHESRAVYENYVRKEVIYLFPCGCTATPEDRAKLVRQHSATCPCSAPFREYTRCCS